MDSSIENEKLILLKNEFPNIKLQCLDEIMIHFDNDYSSTRLFLLELFCEYFETNNSENEIHSANQLVNNKLCIEITKNFYEKLSCQFANKKDQLLINAIQENLNQNQSINLPINIDLAYDLYLNLINYSKNYLINDDYLLDKNVNEINNNLNQTDENLNEIMDTEEALQLSRKEYLKELTEQRNNNLKQNIKDDALTQEWLLEKKRDFLTKHFPGVHLLKLNRLFDLNL